MQDNKKCAFLVAGDFAWEEMDAEISKWFQLGASYISEGCRDHHLCKAAALKSRLKALRR